MKQVPVLPGRPGLARCPPAPVPAPSPGSRVGAERCPRRAGAGPAGRPVLRGHRCGVGAAAVVEDDRDLPRRPALWGHRGAGTAAGEHREGGRRPWVLAGGDTTHRADAVSAQFQLAVPVAVVFAPGSVPGDLPRPLPFRDVQEMEISVNCKRYLWLSLPCPSVRPSWVASSFTAGVSTSLRLFSPAVSPELPGPPPHVCQYHPVLSWRYSGALGTSSRGCRREKTGSSPWGWG